MSHERGNRWVAVRSHRSRHCCAVHARRHIRVKCIAGIGIGISDSVSIDRCVIGKVHERR
jgi:hypothetical protein